MTAEITIGSALRRARATREMSLSEVAQAAGVSTATLSRIETGKQSLDVGLLVAITEVLHISPAEILDEGREHHDGEDELVTSLSKLSSDKRARIMNAAAKRPGSRRATYPLQARLDALLATMDLIRDELSEIQRRQVSHRRR